MQAAYQPPPFAPIVVHHRDAYLIVVEKPAGLLSVPGRGADKADCLQTRVAKTEGPIRVVHRLDMATSGLMLFARDADAQRRLSRLFENREVSKRYVARVHGVPGAAYGEIELPLITDWPRRPRQKVDFVAGKVARTRYTLIEREQGAAASRVHLEPVTGRSHQLRVHLAAIGHPILGDELYAYADDVERFGRLMLHAERLRFVHPYTNALLDVCSPVPF